MEGSEKEPSKYDGAENPPPKNKNTNKNNSVEKTGKQQHQIVNPRGRGEGSRGRGRGAANTNKHSQAPLERNIEQWKHSGDKGNGRGRGAIVTSTTQTTTTQDKAPVSNRNKPEHAMELLQAEVAQWLEQNKPDKHGPKGPNDKVGGSSGDSNDDNGPKIPLSAVCKAHHQDLRDWAKDYVMFIPKNGELIKFFEFWQWKYLVKPYHLTNVHHPFSHYCRAKAVLAVIAAAGRGKDTLTICDLYGSQRNYSMIPDKKKDPTLDIKWDMYGPKVIEGDTARGFTRNNTMTFAADFCLIQDVYMNGDEPITPKFVKTLAMQTNTQTVYIICRMFIGYAGCDAFEEEGAWVRDPTTQLISFSADERQTPYAPHYDLNWLAARGVEGLDIAHMTSIGPYEIFRCSPTPRDAFPLFHEFMQLPALVDMRTIGVPDLGTFVEKYWIKFKICCGSWFMEEAHNPYRDLMVHIPTYEKLVAHYASKPTHGLLMDGCISQVGNEFKDSNEMPILKRRFMQIYNRVLFDTALYVMYATRQQASENMSILQRTFATVNDNLYAARSREYKPTGSALPTLKTILGISVLGYGLFKTISSLVSVLWSRRGDDISGAFTPGPIIARVSQKLDTFCIEGGQKLIRYYDAYKWTQRVYWMASWFLPRYQAETIALMPTVPTLFFQRHLLGQFSAANPWYAVIFAPIQEELCRGTILNYLTGLETIIHLIQMVMTRRWGHAVPSLMHIIFTFVPIPILFRIWFHSTWNVYATAYMARYGLDSVYFHSEPFNKLISEWTGVKTQYVSSTTAEICDYIPKSTTPQTPPLASVLLLGGTVTCLLGAFYMAYLFYLGTKPSKYIYPVEEAKSAWNKFLEHRQDCEDVDLRPGIVPLTEQQIIPATIAKFRPDYTFRSDLKVKLTFYGNMMKLPDVIKMLDIQGDTQYTPVYIYPLLITTAVMYRPQPCITNDIICLCERTWNDPFIDLPGYRYASKEERAQLTAWRHERWRNLARTFNKEFFVKFDFLELSTTVEEAAKLMGSKGNRILVYHNKAIDQGDIPDIENAHVPFHYKKSINLKNDEVICPRFVSSIGQRSIKPRAIVNFDPELLSKMVAISRDISDYLHNVFQFSNLYQIGSIRVRFVYASGYTAEQLTELGNAITECRDVVVMVAGDDSYMYNPWLKGGSLFIEADQSKYDHTQDEGPCTHFDTRWMRYIGVPETFIAMHVDHLSKAYKVKKKFDKVFAWSIGFSAGTQLASGTTETTLLNSIHCIGMYVYYLQEFEKEQDLSKSAVDLGFTVKQRMHATISQGTFLKGWWMPTMEGKLQWLPLPSAMLKLGKLLVRPTDIAVGYDRRVYSEAIRQCAYALARSPGEIPPNYPILGPFLQKMLSLSVVSQVQLPTRFKRLVVKTPCEIDPWVVLELVCDRYKISRKQIFEAEDIIKSVSSLPCMVAHPIFEIMRDCDYG